MEKHVRLGFCEQIGIMINGKHLRIRIIISGRN